MRLNIKRITELLNVSPEVANKVEYEMDCMGIDYSECTTREFNMYAKEAYQYMLETA